MSIQVALLRGINVGGRKLIAMSELRDLFEAVGFAGAKSVLQSGNLVFWADRRKGPTLERVLESETEKRLGASVDYIIRSASEWAAVVASNPFPAEAERDPSHLVVMFLKTTPAARAVKALQTAIKGPERVVAVGRQLYITYPLGIGDSKLTGALIEKALDSGGTTRNWNTVLKLHALTTSSAAGGAREP